VEDWESAKVLKTLQAVENVGGPATEDKLNLSLKNLRDHLKGVTPGDILYLANLPGVGHSSAGKFDELIDVEEFKNVLQNKLELPESWWGYFATYVGFESLNRLRERVVKICEFFDWNLRKYIPEEQIETSVRYCITGTISDKRSNIVNRLKKFGCEFVDVGAADILICNDVSSSSKYKAAVNKGIPIMTEAEFYSKYCGE
jgi:NAD-dependent DNA ligase